MNYFLRLAIVASLPLGLASCASGSPTASDQLTDAQRQECAALRAQGVETNKTGVMPAYCSQGASINWSSEPKDPIKLDFDHKDDKKTP